MMMLMMMIIIILFIISVSQASLPFQHNQQFFHPFSIKYFQLLSAKKFLKKLFLLWQKRILYIKVNFQNNLLFEDFKMKIIADHVLPGVVSPAEAVLSKTKDKRWIPLHPANKHVSELRNVSIVQTEIA